MKLFSCLMALLLFLLQAVPDTTSKFRTCQEEGGHCVPSKIKCLQEQVGLCPHREWKCCTEV
ncbi:PREDICTED: gallinacin-11-like [Merops nubicus]|uniref:gallinacin-11-like n=1 Tax=Merops nubicus TaxID=57421 RepID=UPI0004F0518B|nr:PREDICTED: gallinacin-11-like [Merops nubicus]